MTGNSQKVHRKKGAVKKNVSQYEMNLAQFFVHHPAEHLGEPIVDGGEQREDDPCDNVMEMGDDKIRVVDEDINGRRGHEDPAETTDNEIRNESQGKKHRRGE